MAYFFDPNDAKRTALTSVEVMSDGYVEFAAWHNGPEETEIRLFPAATKDAFLNRAGEPIDMNARRFALFGSCGAKSAQFYLLTSPPRPYSAPLEIKIAQAQALKPPPLEKQATRMQCWAAAISSWRQATDPSITRSTQEELVKKYSDIHNGGCSENRLQTVLHDQGLLIKGVRAFALRDWPLVDIAAELEKQKYPLVVYKSSQLNSHTVVVFGLHSPDGGRPALQIMDPWTGTHDSLLLDYLVGRAVFIATKI